MSSLCAAALASLDGSLALLYESMGKLKAARSVDTAEVIEQLKMSVESARLVRELVWSELPDASWQNREQLDALINKIQEILEARTLEQLRSRLLTLASELERGSIVHRRAHRLSELNQLRDQAVDELRSQASLESAPQILPGPQADQWVEWACSLREPQDAESLQILRDGFAHLDDFVANLECNMWIAGGSPTLETLPELERSTPRTQAEQSRREKTVLSSGSNLAIRVGFDPKHKGVGAPTLTENPPFSRARDVTASTETAAVQYKVPVLSDALATPLVSLDEPLRVLYENLAKLQAAQAIDVAVVIEQLKMAAQSARNVRELVLSELPEASWQNRDELDALLEKIETILDARAAEQQRSRLLTLASELERGSIVHRRAHRLSELNQLRDQAVDELRSQASLERAPQTLPGPQADQWVEWACGLKEPEDAESLQILRDGFARLDDFVANLEPSMWIAAGSPTREILPEPERPAEKTQPETSPMETNQVEEPVVSAAPVRFGLEVAKSSEGHEALRFPHSLYEPSLSALDTDTLTPNYVIPPRTEEEIQRILAQEQALLASMMGVVNDGVDRPVEPLFSEEAFAEVRAAPAIAEHPVEPPFPPEVSRETSTTPASASDLKTRAEEPGGGKKRMLGISTVLMLAVLLILVALGAILWRSRSNRSGNGPVQANERTPETRSIPEHNGYQQTALSADSGTQSSSHKSQTKEQSKEQSKAEDRSVAPKPLAKALPAKPVNELHDGVLRPPAEIPRNVAMVNKEATPPNSSAGIPGAVPGGVPNGIPNNVASIARDIPVAVPKVAAQKVRVSSGVAQGLLVHQVKPKYPQLAREARIQGTVVLQAVIGKDGTVQNLRVLSGHPLLSPGGNGCCKTVALQALLRKWGTSRG